MSVKNVLIRLNHSEEILDGTRLKDCLGLFFLITVHLLFHFCQAMTWHPPWGTSTRNFQCVTSWTWCWLMKRIEDTSNNRWHEHTHGQLKCCSIEYCRVCCLLNSYCPLKTSIWKSLVSISFVQEIVLWRKAPEKIRKRNFHQRYESPESRTESRTESVSAEQPEMWGWNPMNLKLQTQTQTLPWLFTTEQPEVWELSQVLSGLRDILYMNKHPTHPQTLPHLLLPDQVTSSYVSCLASITPGIKKSESHTSAEC